MNAEFVLGKEAEIYQQNLQMLNRIIRIDANPTKRNADHEAYSRSTSLNQRRRRDVDQKINLENQSFLHRLQKIRSVYSNHKWAEEYRKHTILKQNIGQNQRNFYHTIAYV